MLSEDELDALEEEAQLLKERIDCKKTTPDNKAEMQIQLNTLLQRIEDGEAEHDQQLKEQP